ncbi:unnamed protein product [Toxocara canis]|uniref:Secreted protein n=1 Tax=Toxocara canis TaxID=6265 RepID=A0A183TY08_TOXCA|nr:unnamed protein product [Toxocara canis]
MRERASQLGTPLRIIFVVKYYAIHSTLLSSVRCYAHHSVESLVSPAETHVADGQESATESRATLQGTLNVVKPSQA